MLHRVLSIMIFGLAVFVPIEALTAGGAKGKMFNLPDPVTNEVKAITDGTVNIRVTRFGTNDAIQLKDLEGKDIPFVTNNGQVAVTGPDFAFILPPSGSADARQAVNIQFFRTGQQVKALTQILQAVIVDDKKVIENLDVSVPLPQEMGMMSPYPHDPYAVPSVCIQCRPRHTLLSRFFGR